MKWSELTIGRIMKKYFHILCLILLLTLTGCGSEKAETTSEASTEESLGYKQISQTEAKKIMEEESDYIILDVRTQEEFDDGHIPDAICVPNGSIGTEKPEELPDLNQIILVYCRSGRRSKEASKKLADMGYTKVYEFGGIIDWAGPTIKENK